MSVRTCPSEWWASACAAIGVVTFLGLIACCSRSPIIIRALPCVMKIAMGNSSACALTQESEVYCWGRNELGELGQGDRDERLGVVVRVE